METRSALPPLPHVARLRRELSWRNQQFALAKNLPHALSYGEVPTVCYQPVENDIAHGNFLRATYQAIVANPEWVLRLRKHHSQAARCLPQTDRGNWRELDSSASSDALLMNCFCLPGVLRNGRVQDLLGVERGSVPQFGFKPRVPLANGKFDRTEVDMRLGNLLVESKLTESNFQSCIPEKVECYRDFFDAFDSRRLPQFGKKYLCYQLIRNVLAASAYGYSVCLLADERRWDLIEAWYGVISCVIPGDLRLRCKVLTWQELAVLLPAKLRRFLDEKYGIGSSLREPKPAA